nr:hypothetical protein [Tanacetum cinerariifolium]
NPTIYTSCVEQFWATAKVKNINGEAQVHAKVDGKKVVISKASIRRDLWFRDEGGIDCFSNETSVPTKTVLNEVVNEEMYDSLERATTTVTGLDVEQDRGNITKTQSNATLNEPSSIRTGSSSGPRLYKVGLSARVESSADEESLGEEDVSKLGRISDIDANQDIYLVNVYRDEDIFGVNDQDDTLIKSQDKVEEDEQERIIKEKDQLIEEAEEQEQLTDVEKARLFMKFFKNKRKFFAAKRNEEKRNRALTKDQQRSIMSTYLKNMDAWKPRDLKKKSFAQIKELLDKAMERIKNFIDFRTELVKESIKKDKA